MFEMVGWHPPASASVKVVAREDLSPGVFPSQVVQRLLNVRFAYALELKGLSIYFHVDRRLLTPFANDLAEHSRSGYRARY
jgi:hypothetical protein